MAWVRAVCLLNKMSRGYVPRKNHSEGRVFEGPLLSEPSSQLSVAQCTVLERYEIKKFGCSNFIGPEHNLDHS